MTLLVFVFSHLYFGGTIPKTTTPILQNASNIETFNKTDLTYWKWDGRNARLTKSGKKKLDDLKKKIKDNKAIKKQIYASDFEYQCEKVTGFASTECKGTAGGTQKYWKSYDDVCNKPNYCPNVPGL